MQPTRRRRLLLADVNDHIVCFLCGGYYVDATTAVECLHSFCKSCILRYLENNSFCPVCDVQIRGANASGRHLKRDKVLQSLVYKMVPDLYRNEMKRRRDFYARHPREAARVRPEERGAGLERMIFSPTEPFSLALQFHEPKGSGGPREPPVPKRFLQCQAQVPVSVIKKFLRLKYDVRATHAVELRHKKEVLTDDLTLMDVAYIYTWKRNGPLQLHFRFCDARAPPPASIPRVAPASVLAPAPAGAPNAAEVALGDPCAAASQSPPPALAADSTHIDTKENAKDSSQTATSEAEKVEGRAGEGDTGQSPAPDDTDSHTKEHTAAKAAPESGGKSTIIADAPHSSVKIVADSPGAAEGRHSTKTDDSKMLSKEERVGAVSASDSSGAATSPYSSGPSSPVSSSASSRSSSRSSSPSAQRWGRGAGVRGKRGRGRGRPPGPRAIASKRSATAPPSQSEEKRPRRGPAPPPLVLIRSVQSPARSPPPQQLPPASAPKTAADKTSAPQSSPPPATVSTSAAPTPSTRPAALATSSDLTAPKSVADPSTPPQQKGEVASTGSGTSATTNKPAALTSSEKSATSAVSAKPPSTAASGKPFAKLASSATTKPATSAATSKLATSTATSKAATSATTSKVATSATTSKVATSATTSKSTASTTSKVATSTGSKSTTTSATTAKCTTTSVATAKSATTPVTTTKSATTPVTTAKSATTLVTTAKPATTSVTTAKSVTSKPTVGDTPAKPTVSETPTKPAISETSEKTSASETSVKPVISESSVKHTPSVTSVKPTLCATSVKPTASATPAKSATLAKPATSAKPAPSATPAKQVAPVTCAKPATPAPAAKLSSSTAPGQSAAVAVRGVKREREPSSGKSPRHDGVRSPPPAPFPSPKRLRSYSHYPIPCPAPPPQSAPPPAPAPPPPIKPEANKSAVAGEAAPRAPLERTLDGFRSAPTTAGHRPVTHKEAEAARAQDAQRDISGANRKITPGHVDSVDDRKAAVVSPADTDVKMCGNETLKTAGNKNPSVASADERKRHAPSSSSAEELHASSSAKKSATASFSSTVKEGNPLTMTFRLPPGSTIEPVAAGSGRRTPAPSPKDALTVRPHVSSHNQSAGHAKSSSRAVEGGGDSKKMASSTAGKTLPKDSSGTQASKSDTSGVRSTQSPLKCPSRAPVPSMSPLSPSAAPSAAGRPSPAPSPRPAPSPSPRPAPSASPRPTPSPSPRPTPSPSPRPAPSPSPRPAPSPSSPSASPAPSSSPAPPAAHRHSHRNSHNGARPEESDQAASPVGVGLGPYARMSTPARDGLSMGAGPKVTFIPRLMHSQPPLSPPDEAARRARGGGSTGAPRGRRRGGGGVLDLSSSGVIAGRGRDVGIASIAQTLARRHLLQQALRPSPDPGPAPPLTPLSAVGSSPPGRPAPSSSPARRSPAPPPPRSPLSPLSPLASFPMGMGGARSPSPGARPRPPPLAPPPRPASLPADLAAAARLASPPAERGARPLLYPAARMDWASAGRGDRLQRCLESLGLPRVPVPSGPLMHLAAAAAASAARAGGVRGSSGGQTSDAFRK